MASNHQLLLSFAALATTFSIILLCSFSPTEALNGGFSVDLIHRDSPNSPFYNASETHSQRVAKALRRSIDRVNRFKPTCSDSPNSLRTDLISASGEFLLSYSVGTPPVPNLAIADTGSNLIWLQCKPCIKCYNQTTPLFDPKMSTTYKTLSCTSSLCKSLYNSCSIHGKSCQYSQEYGDKSFSVGDLAVETITLGSTTGHPVRLRKTIIGCGHNNNDTTTIEASTGVVGLGGGKVSLVSQLHSSIGGKFSYCLAPFLFSPDNTSSKLSFGSHAVVSGFGTVSTPLEYKRYNTFYYVTLEAMSVGSKRLKLSGSSASGGSKGNIFIDSGTTITMLPTEFYSKFESAVAKEINFERVEDPTHFFSLCYNISDDFNVPSITAHFRGADVKLNNLTSSFSPVTAEVVCLAFRAGEPSVFGNLAQSNLLIGYDLVKKTVSFKPTDCTKL